jgi:glycosyltransferase involved in cell wall biosynthesis
MIENYGITERVLIVGNLTDELLRSIYRGAKLFILMSRNDDQDIEGFGLVFLEAAMMGIPVIGCRGTGAEDAIDNGINGYLVDINSKEDIVKKAGKILDDKVLWSNFSQGSVLFANKMNWENKVKQYVKIYLQF